MTTIPNSDIEEICTTLGSIAHAFSGKRILITGARGFLGRYFTDVFMRLNDTVLESPCKITAVDNLITAGPMGAGAAAHRHIDFVNHDIIKPFHLAQPVDFVLHLAGIASPHYYRKWPLATLEVATIGLKNVLELTKTTSARLVFFSSSEIYGDPDAANVPTKENCNGSVSCLGARACYEESKRLGETLVQIYGTQYDVQGTIVRPFNVYGPGMQKFDYRVLPNFAAKILANEPVNIYGTGKQTRTFCYVTDAIRGFLQVLLHGRVGQAYNIGNPAPELSIIDLVDTIERVVPAITVDRRVIDHPETYPADEPQRRCPDITKAVLELGYMPTVDFDVGLRRFFDWAKDAYAR